MNQVSAQLITTGTEDAPTQILYIRTNNTAAQVTTAGYLTNNLLSTDLGQLSIYQMAVVYTTDQGALLMQVTSSGGIFSLALPAEVASGVTYTGTLTPGDLVSVNAAGGIVQDSGIVATNVVQKTGANQMGAGAAIYDDKGTGTVSTGAVTVNHQSGAITAAVTTAAAATTTFTLNNSLILGTTNLVETFLAGGTNTTLPGVQVSAVATGVGTATVSITNNNVAGTALNGNVIIGFKVL